MALLLRSRLEAHRTCTVERSTLQFQALIDQMPTAESTIAERSRLLHALPLPSKWELERELAPRFLSLGPVKSALEIFERLEVWEEVVKCWQATEQRDRALAVVRELLAGRKAEAEIVLARGKANATGPCRAMLDAAREPSYCVCSESSSQSGCASISNVLGRCWGRRPEGRCAPLVVTSLHEKSAQKRYGVYGAQ